MKKEKEDEIRGEENFRQFEGKLPCLKSRICE